MYCGTCGAPVVTGNRFCSSCGATIDGDAYALNGVSQVASVALGGMGMPQGGQPLQTVAPQFYGAKREKPRGRAMLIAAGIVLALAALGLAIGGLFAGYQFYFIVLQVMFLPPIELGIAALAVLFSGKPDKSRVLLVLGAVQGALIVVDVVLINIFFLFFPLFSIPIALQALGTIMLIYGALLNGRLKAQTTPALDSNGMIENKKPRGKALLIAGGIVLMLSTLFPIYNCIEILPYFLPDLAALLVDGSFFAFFLSVLVPLALHLLVFTISLMALAEAALVKSAKRMIICSIVTGAFAIMCLIDFFFFRFLYSYTTHPLFTALPLLAGGVLVFVGGNLNKKSPERVMPSASPVQHTAQNYAYPAGMPAQGAGAYVAYDAPNIGFAVLGFFFPVVGLILFLVWKDQAPLKAKSCGKGALIGVIAEVALPVIIFGVLALRYTVF